MHPELFKLGYPMWWVFANLWGRVLVWIQPAHIRRTVRAIVRLRTSGGQTVTLNDLRHLIHMAKLVSAYEAKHPPVTAEQHSPEA